MAYGVVKAIFGELDMVGGESGIISIIAKLAIVKNRFFGYVRETLAWTARNESGGSGQSAGRRSMWVA